MVHNYILSFHVLKSPPQKNIQPKETLSKAIKCENDLVKIASSARMMKEKLEEFLKWRERKFSSPILT